MKIEKLANGRCGVNQYQWCSNWSPIIFQGTEEECKNYIKEHDTPKRGK